MENINPDYDPSEILYNSILDDSVQINLSTEDMNELLSTIDLLPVPEPFPERNAWGEINTINMENVLSNEGAMIEFVVQDPDTFQYTITPLEEQAKEEESKSEADKDPKLEEVC